MNEGWEGCYKKHLCGPFKALTIYL